MRYGMIAPHALLEFDAANIGGDGAPLTAVKPAVGTPGERVGDAVGVFHAEARQQHFGISVGHVVAIAVGVEEQVGCIENEDAAVAEGQAAGEIQAGDEIF